MPVGVNEQLKAGRPQRNYAGANTASVSTPVPQKTEKRACRNISENDDGRCGKPISVTSPPTETFCVACRT